MNIKHIFLNIKSTKRLEFEELSKENYHQLVNLFQEDSNPFIQEEYRSLKSAEAYYNGYNYFRTLSPKVSNCDWFFKLKSTGEYVGLLNLYDLIFNKESEYHKICSIGFATGEKYRRKGLTKEAVHALIDYAFTELKLDCVTASTSNDNIASRLFLKRVGFTMNIEDHNDDLNHKYFELRKS
jgi:RimJ/RimL family protein N-acetyltransferase